MRIIFVNLNRYANLLALFGLIYKENYSSNLPSTLVIINRL